MLTMQKSHENQREPFCEPSSIQCFLTVGPARLQICPTISQRRFVKSRAPECTDSESADVSNSLCAIVGVFKQTNALNQRLSEFQTYVGYRNSCL